RFFVGHRAPRQRVGADRRRALLDIHERISAVAGGGRDGRLARPGAVSCRERRRLLIGPAACHRHGIWHTRRARARSAKWPVGGADRRRGDRSAGRARLVDAAVAVGRDRQRRRGLGGLSAMAFATARNPIPLLIAAVPLLDIVAFRREVLARIADGGRLLLLTALPGDGNASRLLAAVADDAHGEILLCSALVAGAYPALTPDCPAAHYFEREIREQYGIEPKDHPWLKPVRFPPGGPMIGDTEFFSVAGAEIHEVAVGPVHAGVIEPGHFRFNCHGERVIHLEISLGYQHRGVERALRGGPTKRTITHMETLAGDTSIGHATAYSQILEALSGCRVPARAHALRGIALELERLANHTGGLGALANDIGFLPTASYCGRLRGDFLNLTASICGSRFGRGLVRPGGVGFDVDPKRAGQMLERLTVAQH